MSGEFDLNPAWPEIRVVKFGGTTIGNPALMPQIITRIRERLDLGKKVIVIVSAMGRKGDAYSTETLLSLLPQDERYVCRRERDLLMACGEIISAVYLSCRLRQSGIPAVARAGFEAGIQTDSEHGDARILRIDPDFLLKDLVLYPVVVITGFQGVTSSGRITTLGRGGSDTSAMAVGAALKADYVEIFTDTDGVFSADPRIVPEAHLIESMNAEDIHEMAWKGAKVLHPRAAELSIRHQVPLRVGRVDRSGVHTSILPKMMMEPPAMITGIASGPPVDQITCYITEAPEQTEVAEIFNTIASAGISMDMFTITENLVRFTVNHPDYQNASSALMSKQIRFSIRTGCMKVSIIGAGMHGMKGVMARFTRILVHARIPVLQTVDSHATISALVPESLAVKAQEVLHREFIIQM